MIMSEAQKATSQYGKYAEFATRVISLPLGCEFSVYEDGTPANILRTRLWSAMRNNEDVQDYLESTKQRLKFRTVDGQLVLVSVLPEKS